MTIAGPEQVRTPSKTDRDALIQLSQANVIERLSANPEKAVTTLAMSGSIDDGLVCSVTQGSHSAVMDMGIAMGGEARGPSPGFFGRAGIVGCVAIATKMTAAREGLEFRSVHVDLEMDSDDLAIFGLGSRKAAPLQTRIMIQIETDEPADAVSGLVERVLNADPWYLALRDPQTVSVKWQKSSRGELGKLGTPAEATRRPINEDDAAVQTKA
ncbi:OsmC family protein [uncultured Roseobacter sp.]|uniref:OsmC family protein n=1 Tax=uncultured Roseobacter sp. TaxID=114847 RepID=UPI002604C695|nr:OsmC family protein [uncultured Roseobacter sp.]